MAALASLAVLPVASAVLVLVRWSAWASERSPTRIIPSQVRSEAQLWVLPVVDFSVLGVESVLLKARCSTSGPTAFLGCNARAKEKVPVAYGPRSR
jgi:hypothetical protein